MLENKIDSLKIDLWFSEENHKQKNQFCRVFFLINLLESICLGFQLLYLQIFLFSNIFWTYAFRKNL